MTYDTMTTDDELRELIALGAAATGKPFRIQASLTDIDYVTTAANLAPEIAAELIAAREEIQRLRVALESLRITSHTECEDCWYSCPKSDDYCGEDDREHCACGMDKQNAIIDAALNGGDL